VLLRVEHDESTTGTYIVNWGRGFFRLWVVVFLLWVVAMAWLFDPVAIYASPIRLLYEQAGKKYEIEIPAGRDKDTIKRNLAEVIAEARSWEPNVAPSGGTPEERAASIIDSYDFDKPRRELLRFLMATLLPPIGLLMVGLTLRWIGAGFRPRQIPN
jgi:hypothetical protein